MRAVRYHDYGPPEVLRVEDAPERHAPPGAVRIRTQAASVNPIDWQMRSGALRAAVTLPFPIVPGRDAAGVVDEVGDGAEGVTPGDVVFGLGGTQDTFAEFAVLTAWALVPDPWTVVQAASSGLAASTALVALNELGPIAGDTVLIEGASGAVGSAIAAFAIDRGARVLGTARASNHEFLDGLGVVPLAYGSGLADRVAALAPDGVGAAVDTSASGSLDELVRIADRTVTVADPVRAARLGIPMIWAENDSRLMDEAARLGSRGGYTPRVARELPAGNAVEAHRLAESGAGGGKVVVTDF